ncbi:unnamed protein product [Prorocentrum cordatum]|uniref:Uncharacterized protein n=1 Tax=Prorocentrum cordatum TaxID=2364126 RepID=A0ABN9X3T2_9DINO|nr:unnamed protein product [Polarella glacialis]
MAERVSLRGQQYVVIRISGAGVTEDLCRMVVAASVSALLYGAPDGRLLPGTRGLRMRWRRGTSSSSRATASPATSRGTGPWSARRAGRGAAPPAPRRPPWGGLPRGAAASQGPAETTAGL